MLVRWWRRRRKPGEAETAAGRPSPSAAEDKALVEYSEFVLVLSPEPLWQRWKMGGKPPAEQD